LGPPSFGSPSFGSSAFGTSGFGFGTSGFEITEDTAPGFEVRGPLGRTESREQLGSVVLSPTEAVLLCVPDAELRHAAEAIPPGPFVGHCSGASDLDPLERHGTRAFSMHPLMTVPASGEVSFRGAAAAVAGASPQALGLARLLAAQLGMETLQVEPGDRAAYHAAATIASNFLVTLECAAERLAGDVGVERRLLVPLVRATVENWARSGADALSGPVLRGDEVTVERQRRAVGERAPELSLLFDALIEATRALAARTAGTAR
jgi:predicted short-subunit dehydrogenase-like oxidoreductase (DUF2520 family)